MHQKFDLSACASEVSGQRLNVRAWVRSKVTQLVDPRPGFVSGDIESDSDFDSTADLGPAQSMKNLCQLGVLRTKALILL
jgi:hypothetical protein